MYQVYAPSANGSWNATNEFHYRCPGGLVSGGSCYEGDNRSCDGNLVRETSQLNATEAGESHSYNETYCEAECTTGYNVSGIC